MNPSSDYVSVNGVRLHCLRWGGGGRHEIVLLHPNSHCGGVWSPLAGRLAADGLTVIALDMRGHGRSDKPETGYSWSVLREDTVGLLTALDLNDVLLVGHSRGGGVSLLAAAAARDRVRGVVVFEPTVPLGLDAAQQAPPAAVAARVALMAERARGRRAVFPSREALIEHWRGRDAFRGWRDAYLQAYAAHGTVVREDGSIELACPPWVEARLYEVLPERDAWEGIYCPDLPVLAMYGERSGRLGAGRDPVAPLRAMFPRCEVRTMPDGTHFGPMEHPEFFERAVREFAGRRGFGRPVA